MDCQGALLANRVEAGLIDTPIGRHDNRRRVDGHGIPMTEQAGNRIRAMYAADAHFVGEHSGAADRELKEQWLPLLQKQSGVASAYLACVRHGGSADATMALCIRVTDGAAAKTAVGRCAAVFVSRFGPEQPLDILILTTAQERALQAVCPPFFREEGAAERSGAQSSPIVWFEIQLAPSEFRLAVLPGQPILFGSSETAGGPAATWLLRVKENPNAAKAFLDYLLSKRGQEVMAQQSLLHAIRPDAQGEATAAALQQELGAALKPIRVSDDLLKGLEPATRMEFFNQWRQAMSGR